MVTNIYKNRYVPLILEVFKLFLILMINEESSLVEICYT